jgi:magnesium transporter
MNNYFPSTSMPTQIPAQLGVSTQELFQKRWFCVSLLSSGKTFKQDAESPIPFLDVINRSVVSWVDYMTDDPYKDIPMVAAQMGFSEPFITSAIGDLPISYQDFDTEMWLKLPSIQIRGTDVNAYPFFMFIRNKIVFTIHVSLVDKRFIRLRRYSDTILKKVLMESDQQDKVTNLMIRIIDTNNDSNFRHLRVIEENSDNLNDMLMNVKTDRTALGPKIYEMKHSLIVYMNALWDSVDVLHTLRYGDAELITDDQNILNLLSVMTDEVKGQIGLAEHMSEVIASGLEVMQSIYNNQLQILNNKLAMVVAYLTVIGTAILVPNTIATTLGNAVFDLGPEDLWWYAILMIGGTLLATLCVWIWVKRSGWMPNKPDSSEIEKSNTKPKKLKDNK